MGDAPSRRDLFRLLGRPLSKLAGAPAPADEAPLEDGRLVVDLALLPVAAGAGRRFLPAGRAASVLLARVSESHFAALPGDCPRCGGALRFDAERDGVLCVAGDAAFRLDGSPLEDPAGPRLPSLPVRRAGPRVEVDLAP